MKFLILLLSSLFIFSEMQGQRTCSSAEYAAGLSSLQTGNNNPYGSTARDTVANENITIPVIIHIVYHNASQNISDAQVISQLKVLNEDFRRLNNDASNTPNAFKPFAADTRINFCLAHVDTRDRPVSGIIRKYTTKESFSVDDAVKFSAAGGDDAWDSRKYLNIWVCNMEGNNLGYASPPGGQADKDGIVIQFDAFGNTGNLRTNFNKGRTTTHEAGHWLGLRHIWGDDNCGDDAIFDTPQQAYYNNNCPSFPHLSSCSPNANGDMFMNFMDYTNDACMNMFTEGQKSKMRGLFSVSGPRNSFLFSFACDSSLATAAPLPTADTTTVAVLKPSVQIFPNPVHQELNLVALNGYELAGKSISVFNTTGMLLMKKTITNANDKLNLSSFNSGVYIIVIGQGSDRTVLKLIKI